MGGAPQGGGVDVYPGTCPGSFGNIHSHTYGITGGNVAENMIWGRISARHAASLDAWDEKK